VLIVGRQVEEAVSVEDDVETAIKLLEHCHRDWNRRTRLVCPAGISAMQR